MKYFLNWTSKHVEGKKKLSVYGIPFDANSSYRCGSRFAPSELLKVSEHDNISGYSSFFHCSVNSLIDFSSIKMIEINNYSWDWTRQIIQKEIFNENSQNHISMYFGGDHSVEIPIISKAVQKKKRIGILYFDAHLDYYNSYYKNSFSHACTLKRIIDENPHLSKDILVIGAREFTEDQLSSLQKDNVKLVTAWDLFNKSGYRTIFDFIQRLKKLNIPIHISFDCDVMDPSCLNAVSNPSPCGLNLFHLQNVFKELRNCKVESISILEYNPLFDKDNLNATIILWIIRELLCGIFSGEIHD
ncbi:MAG: arginase family protein [Promethearchaeota archaeon]